MRRRAPRHAPCTRGLCSQRRRVPRSHPRGSSPARTRTAPALLRASPGNPVGAGLRAVGVPRALPLQESKIDVEAVKKRMGSLQLLQLGASLAAAPAACRARAVAQPTSRCETFLQRITALRRALALAQAWAANGRRCAGGGVSSPRAEALGAKRGLKPDAMALSGLVESDQDIEGSEQQRLPWEAPRRARARCM